MVFSTGILSIGIIVANDAHYRLSATLLVNSAAYNSTLHSVIQSFTVKNKTHITLFVERHFILFAYICCSEDNKYIEEKGETLCPSTALPSSGNVWWSLEKPIPDSSRGLAVTR
jgi:hypothetical protein